MESSPYLQAASYHTTEDSALPPSFQPIQPTASSAAALMLMRYNLGQHQYPVAAHQGTHYGGNTNLLPFHPRQAAASPKTAAPFLIDEMEIAHTAYDNGGVFDTRQDLHYYLDFLPPGHPVSFTAPSAARASPASVNPRFDLEQIRHHHITPTFSRYVPSQAAATAGTGTAESREIFDSEILHFNRFHSLYYGQPEEQLHAAQTTSAPLVTSTPPLLPYFPFEEFPSGASPTSGYNQQEDVRASEQYEYKQLEDGSKMTRYVDAGIASEWIPVNQSRSQLGS